MGIPTAGFWGGAPNRDKLLEDMVAGKYRVIVANRQMLLGINVPRWTHFYNCLPSSNAPNYYQEMSRVRTPHTVTLRNRKTGEVKTWEKKVAVVRDYLDDFGPCYGCMNTRRGVYDKDKKVTIRSTQKPNEKDPTCGMCKNFEKCIGYGKSIKNDTHVCHRFSQRKKRTLGSRRD